VRLAAAEERVAKFPSLRIRSGRKQIVDLESSAAIQQRFRQRIPLTLLKLEVSWCRQIKGDSADLRIHVELTNKTLPVVVLEESGKNDPGGQ
jgi:hypothetical protein